MSSPTSGEAKDFRARATVLTTSDEERAIRAAVGGIAGAFGPDHYHQQVDDGGNCSELWNALGAKGYLALVVTAFARSSGTVRS
jgi:hypothetical protein